MNSRQRMSVNGSGQSMSKEPDPQVVPKAERRRFSNEYKLRILSEADACSERGAIGCQISAGTGSPALYVIFPDMLHPSDAYCPDYL
jgi:hypothetical protein